MLGALKRHEALITRSEETVGRPLKVPKLRCPVREALERIARNPHTLVEETP